MTQQTKVKYSKFLGSAWLLIAFYDLYLGVDYLYKYSNPLVAWLYMIPFWITISKFFLATFAFLIGTAVLRKKLHPRIIEFSLILLLYIVIDFLKIGSEMLADSGSNIVLFALSLLTIKLNLEFKLKHLMFWKDPESIVFLAFGLLPYFIYPWVSYEIFSFLH